MAKGGASSSGGDLWMSEGSGLMTSEERRSGGSTPRGGVIEELKKSAKSHKPLNFVNFSESNRV